MALRETTKHIILGCQNYPLLFVSKTGHMDVCAVGFVECLKGQYQQGMQSLPEFNLQKYQYENHVGTENRSLH